MTPDEIKNIIDTTKAALKVSLTTTIAIDSAEVNAVIESYIADGEDRFANLLSAMQSGSSVKYLLARLKDERFILLGQFLSLAVIGIALAQTAINNAIAIFLTAVEKVLPPQ